MDGMHDQLQGGSSTSMVIAGKTRATGADARRRDALWRQVTLDDIPDDAQSRDEASARVLTASDEHRSCGPGHIHVRAGCTVDLLFEASPE